MTALRPDLPALPSRMARLPIDERGYPVPYFVAWVQDGKEVKRGQGEPDFRAMSSDAFENCVRYNVCWLCGQMMGVYKSFVLGPMCALNRTTSEPGCHLECADFAARACPFLTRPKQKRNEHELLAATVAGIQIRRNPGVALVWTSRKFHLFGDGKGGVLFRIGEASHVRWYREGRPATRAEVMESIESGLPILKDLALKDKDVPGALAELERLKALVLPLLPEA